MSFITGPSIGLGPAWRAPCTYCGSIGQHCHWCTYATTGTTTMTITLPKGDANVATDLNLTKKRLSKLRGLAREANGSDKLSDVEALEKYLDFLDEADAEEK